jgi:rhodanese-related sulfurtransferase
MKTITPFELQMLIDKRNVDLIDVRPKKEFKAAHALVARPIPLVEFEPHSVLSHRKLDKRAPLYIMCRNRILASIAAGGLAAAGVPEPIVVDGGIEAWERQCLPVIRERSWRMPVIDAPTAALLAAFAFGLGLAFHGFFFVVALFVLATWAAPYAFEFASRRDGEVEHNLWHRALVAECG